jgi:hypothetical protein
MNFFRSMEIDPTCKFSPPQSRSEGISFYGFSAPRRFHATKTQSRHSSEAYSPSTKRAPWPIRLRLVSLLGHVLSTDAVRAGPLRIVSSTACSQQSPKGYTSNSQLDVRRDFRSR